MNGGDIQGKRSGWISLPADLFILLGHVPREVPCAVIPRETMLVAPARMQS